jgi:hypothetical protein
MWQYTSINPKGGYLRDFASRFTLFSSIKLVQEGQFSTVMGEEHGTAVMALEYN